jgi:hypothetical protein
VGRPRLRLEECVWQDIRILILRNWRSVASNREEWPAIQRKAMAHTGLPCQCWWWWLTRIWVSKTTAAVLPWISSSVYNAFLLRNSVPVFAFLLISAVAVNGHTIERRMVETTNELKRTWKDSGCGIIEALSKHFSGGEVRSVVTFPRYIYPGFMRSVNTLQS